MKRREIVVAKPAQALDRPTPPKLTEGDVENLKGILENVYAKNTKVAYESDWKMFVAFCESRSASALPAHPAVVVAYIAALAKGEIPDHHGKLYPRKLATIGRHLVSISTKHKLADLPSPRDTKEVRLAFKAIRRQIGEPQKPKTAALVDVVYRMVRTLPDGDRRIRNAALLLVGFFGALRQSEVVDIDIEHLKPGTGFIRVLIPRSKADQEGKGQRVELIANPDEPDVCVVEAVRRLCETLPDDRGPLFRRILRDGSYGGRLRPSAVAKLVKAGAKRIGLDPKSFAGHSLRSGFATSAYLAGGDVKGIQHQTRHASLAGVARYIHDTDRIDDHVGTKMIRGKR